MVSAMRRKLKKTTGATSVLIDGYLFEQANISDQPYPAFNSQLRGTNDPVIHDNEVHPDLFTFFKRKPFRIDSDFDADVCLRGTLGAVASFRKANPAKINHHRVNSIPKCICAGMALALADMGFNVCDIYHTWLGNMGNAQGPTVAVAIYDDLLTDSALARACIARNIPLLAVISADPQRPYHSGGITYDYDPVTRRYQGRSLGRKDSFVY